MVHEVEHNQTICPLKKALSAIDTPIVPGNPPGATQALVFMTQTAKLIA